MTPTDPPRRRTYRMENGVITWRDVVWIATLILVILIFLNVGPS